MLTEGAKAAVVGKRDDVKAGPGAIEMLELFVAVAREL